MSKKLYVGNLALDINNKDLKQLFAEAGVCESASVITDPETGRSRGFGYVEMASNDDGQKAIQQLDGEKFKGLRVCIYSVKLAAT